MQNVTVQTAGVTAELSSAREGHFQGSSSSTKQCLKIPGPSSMNSHHLQLSEVYFKKLVFFKSMTMSKRKSVNKTQASLLVVEPVKRDRVQVCQIL